MPSELDSTKHLKFFEGCLDLHPVCSELMCENESFYPEICNPLILL